VSPPVFEMAAVKLPLPEIKKDEGMPHLLNFDIICITELNHV
jgi:hypothetical protein